MYILYVTWVHATRTYVIIAVMMHGLLDSTDSLDPTRELKNSVLS